MRLIKLLLSIFFISISTISSAQEKINIVIKAGSDLDYGRLNNHLIDMNNVFAIREEIPRDGLIYTEGIRGSHPIFQIIDIKKDTVYLVLLNKKEGQIFFSKDSKKDILQVKTSEGLIVLSDNNIY